MPKLKKQQDAVAETAWIDLLTDGGGTWGKGVRATVQDLSSQIDGLESEIKEKQDILDKRRSALKGIVKQSEKQAASLFTADEIEGAKSVAAIP